jgi:hypothetical protein
MADRDQPGSLDHRSEFLRIAGIRGGERFFECALAFEQRA